MGGSTPSKWHLGQSQRSHQSHHFSWITIPHGCPLRNSHFDLARVKYINANVNPIIAHDGGSQWSAMGLNKIKWIIWPRSKWASTPRFSIHNIVLFYYLKTCIVAPILTREAMGW